MFLLIAVPSVVGKGTAVSRCLLSPGLPSLHSLFSHSVENVAPQSSSPEGITEQAAPRCAKSALRMPGRDPSLRRGKWWCCPRAPFRPELVTSKTGRHVRTLPLWQSCHCFAGFGEHKLQNSSIFCPSNAVHCVSQTVGQATCHKHFVHPITEARIQSYGEHARRTMHSSVTEHMVPGSILCIAR